MGAAPHRPGGPPRPDDEAPAPLPEGDEEAAGLDERLEPAPVGPGALGDEAVVPAGLDEERVDYVAALLFPSLGSPTAARKRRRAGLLLQNDVWVEQAGVVVPGDRLRLLPQPERGPVSRLPLQVVYEDDELAVVLKPAGLRTSGPGPRTLGAALAHNLRPCRLPDALPRPHPVHRLDDRTAGLVICAKSATAARRLGADFEERRVHKRYEAVVIGRLEGFGRVEAPVGGRASASRWAAVQHVPSRKLGWLTLVSLWPETGRTHQLRVHMAGLGHPLLGDGLYTAGVPNVLDKGLFLFALGLDFSTPAGLRLSLQAPRPPKVETRLRWEAREWLASRGLHRWIPPNAEDRP